MSKYLASLADANLSEPIEWEVDSLAEAASVLERRGTWQPSPDGGGDILLGDGCIWIKPLAWPNESISHTITIGPRGGVRINRV